MSEKHSGVFSRFANFYFCFIQGFNKIIRPFISMLKTINLSKKFLTKVFENDELMVDGSNSLSQNLVKPKKLKNY